MPDALADLLGNILSNAVSWLVSSLAAHRGRPSDRDRAISSWFDTYELSDHLGANVVLPTGVSETDAAAWLESNDCQAVLFELIIVDLTDSPEIQLNQVRQNMLYSCDDAFPNLDRRALQQFSDAIFDSAHDEMVELIARLTVSSQEILNHVREAAFYGRIAALLDAIRRQGDSNAPLTPADRVRDRQYIDRYRQVAAHEHGYLQPPDFERRRQIPIENLYITPDIIAEHADPPALSQSKRISLTTLAQQIDRTVLLGDPGGGKTTAVSVIINSLCQTALGNRVPVLVILRDYAKESPPPLSILAYVEQRLETHYQCAPPPGLVERLLLSGSAVVFFDGLDELVDTGHRREVSQIVENFCMSYPLTPVLATSRRIGYDEARLDPAQFSIFQLAEFSVEQSARYAASWFAQERRLGEAEPAEWAAAFIRESAVIPDLRSNPLMLALLCILYRGEGSLPRNRPAVYERCSTLLFETWDSSRNIQVNPRARDLIEPVLRYLAYWLMTRDVASPVVTEAQLVQETATYLKERRYEELEEATRVAREFITFCKGRAWVFTEVGSTAEGEPLFTFSHRTFLEYFAAAYLASIRDSPEQLASALSSYIARQEWDVVAQLALQIKSRQIQDGAARFYSNLLGSKKYSAPAKVGNVLAFLARCLRFVEVQPSIVRGLARRCIEYCLEEPQSRERDVPLGLLMTIETVREPVANVLSESLSAVASESESSRATNALHLMGSLSTPLYMGESGLESEGLSESAAYWFSLGNNLLVGYRNKVLAGSARDRTLLFVAYNRHWLSLREIPDWPVGPLGFLLDGSISVGIGGASWIAPASILVKGYALGGDELLFSQLEEIAELLADMGPAPWSLYVSRGYSVFSDISTAGVIARTSSSDAWAGACMLAAILFEIEPESVGGMPLGMLSEFGPYLALRYRTVRRTRTDEPAAGDRNHEVSLKLPTLDIGPYFAEVLRQWASGDLSLLSMRDARAEEEFFADSDEE